jgi:hypothetical protein
MMNKNTIQIRYGETFERTTPLGTDFAGLSTLTLYVGKEGQNLPTLTIPATISVDGIVATFLFESVEIPLGTYRYMVTAIYDDGTIEKYPDRNGYSTDLPMFEVLEVTDVAEEVI